MSSERVIQTSSAPLRRLTGVQVVATGGYVPEQIVRNEDLATLGCDPQWIMQRTGIRERRFATQDEALTDIALPAARDALAQAGVDPGSIDLLVLSHEQNGGLGAAIRTGIYRIVDDAGPSDVVMAMDADSTHPADSMPRMVDLVHRGADVVIASRYVPGATVTGVPGYRRVLSDPELKLGETYMDGLWDCAAIDQLTYRLSARNVADKVCNLATLARTRMACRSPSGAPLTTSAAAPSPIGQHIGSVSGGLIMRLPSTSSTVISARNCAVGLVTACFTRPPITW